MYIVQDRKKILENISTRDKKLIIVLEIWNPPPPKKNLFCNKSYKL